MSFRRVLIANRGEIALRIVRTLREMGIESIVVYSDVDAHSPHVLAADIAVHLEGRTPSETYLDMERIIEIARRYNADAIHPGYGFLAENPVFSRRVREEGIVFIGPTPEEIERLGDKATAKEIARRAGVPTAPSSPPLKDTEEIARWVEKIGLPVLLKASAGGGGKGMKKVVSTENLLDTIEMAKREAMSAFGDDTIIVEKFIFPVRHIEVQVMADTHGNVLTIGERECSLQRRHQKIIEESPSPALSDEKREELLQYARRIIEESGYTGAGTVEFMYSNGNFYFLEVNTRIQVEHPVSEMRFGLDLIRMQIEIAEGLPLPEEIPFPTGHSIEARLYAEDPYQNFFPQTGRVHVLEFPHIPGVRIDYGIAEGNEITPYYDPMIAKIIAHGPDRESARRRLIQALQETLFIGPANNQHFLIYLLESEEFITGETYTHSVGDILGRYVKEDFSIPPELLRVVSENLRSSPGRRASKDGKRPVNPVERIKPDIYP